MKPQRRKSHTLDITIGAACAADADDIIRVQRLAFKSQAELYDDEQLPPLLETVAQLRGSLRSARVLKAVVDGVIVGSVRGIRDGGTCHVGRLSVHPDHQRKGIASRLMEALESEFSDCNRFELFTGARSHASIELYRGLGYAPGFTSVENGHVPLVHLRKAATQPRKAG